MEKENTIINEVVTDLEENTMAEDTSTKKVEELVGVVISLFTPELIAEGMKARASQYGVNVSNFSEKDVLEEWKKFVSESVNQMTNFIRNFRTQESNKETEEFIKSILPKPSN